MENRQAGRHTQKENDGLRKEGDRQKKRREREVVQKPRAMT